MLAGIQINNIGMLKNVQESGFQNIELTLEGMEAFAASGYDMRMGGIQIISIKESLVQTSRERWERILDYAQQYRISCIVIETKGVKTVGALPEWIVASASRIRQMNIRLCVENGYFQENGHFVRNNTCDSHELLNRIHAWNRQMGHNCIHIALNIGYANLFGYNIGAMIEELMNDIILLHVNDNDGIHDMHQLPYSFTSGRGRLSTGWYKIVWSLTKIRYDGAFLFDVDGLLANTPEGLVTDMMKLTYAIYEEWERQLHIENALGQAGKTLVLFGAGQIFRNYMAVWGKEYPPAFCVDNNPEIWGEIRCGIEVKQPEAILEIPPEERNVWICNLYYRQITEQLRQMGVTARWFDDQYII